MQRPIAVIATVLTAVLGMVACSGPEPAPEPSRSASPQSKKTITVGAYNVSESQIVANLYAGALNAVGQPAEVRTLTRRASAVPALEKGDIGLVGESAATLTEFLNRSINGPAAPPQASTDLATTMAALERLTEEVGLVVLEPADAANQNAFAVRREFAEAQDLTTLTDLAEYSDTDPVTVGGPPECPQRPFCLLGLQEDYGLQVAGFMSLDAGGPLTKSAVRQGTVDVGLVLSSDGSLDQFDLVTLTDDKNLQPAENFVPVLNEDVATPLVTDTLNEVSAKLTLQQMQDLDYAVDWVRQDPARVADAWLAVNGLG